MVSHIGNVNTCTQIETLWQKEVFGMYIVSDLRRKSRRKVRYPLVEVLGIGENELDGVSFRSENILYFICNI